MNKKFIEHIATIAFAAFLVGTFFYQAAHAAHQISFSNYLNGTITRTFDNGTTITHHNEFIPMNVTDFGNSTWTMYNSTSGSISRITFHEEMIGIAHHYTWTRTLNGHLHKGFFTPPMGSGGYSYLYLYTEIRNHDPHGPIYSLRTVSLHPITISSDHMKFRKNSGNRIVGCSGYDIHRAELPFHFWLVITIRDFVERYSRPGSYIHAMQQYRLNDYGIVWCSSSSRDRRRTDAVTHVSSTMGASHPGTLSNIGIPLVSSVSAGFVLGMVRG